MRDWNQNQRRPLNAPRANSQQSPWDLNPVPRKNGELSYEDYLRSEQGEDVANNFNLRGQQSPMTHPWNLPNPGFGKEGYGSGIGGGPVSNPYMSGLNFGNNEGMEYEDYLAGEKESGRYSEEDETTPWHMRGDPVPMLATNTDYGAYNIGSAIGNKDPFGLAAGIGDTAIGLGRNLLSGLADAKDTSRVYGQSMREQDRLNRGVYNRDRRQYEDPSRRYKYGALFQTPKGYFDEGGEMSEEEAMMMQMMEQQQGGGQPQEGQEQMPQEGGEDVQQQVSEMAMQLVEQFQGDLETIEQFLVQEGIQEEIAQMVMQMAAEIVQGGQGQPQQQEEELPEAGGGSAVMRDTMNGRMDMPMDFRNGGVYPRLPM